jgi:hypothetical protein
LSLPKQFALISRAVVDASGKFSTFKQAVYMKALTAKKGKGGWDLLASEIHSGRVFFRMEKHVDDTHGCTGRAGRTARGTVRRPRGGFHRDESNQVNKERSRESPLSDFRVARLGHHCLFAKNRFR